MHTKLFSRGAFVGATLLIAGCAQTVSDVKSAISSGTTSAQEQRAKKQAEIPVCARKLGSIAVKEPEKDWWTPLQLSSPEAVIKIFVMKSGCFTLVDRGKGFAAVEQERALAGMGQLRHGSNMGRGQIKVADYVLVPDLVSKNENAGGTALFALAGAMLPGVGGALVSGLKLTDRTADVVLTVTDVRSTEQKAMAEGHANKTDIGFGAGGGVFAGGGFGAAGAGSYQNTEIGQVVTLAYLDAYTKLVTQLGGALPTDASAANMQQAVTMMKSGSLHSRPSLKSKTVRSLSSGQTLYPTGVKDGVWWEVTDEIGNKGWVSSLLVALAK